MDIFGFSADMLPKLRLLFSGYYVPKFCKLSAQIFAQILRDFDARLARHLILECKTIRKRAETRFCALRNNAGRLHAIFVRAARRFFSEILQFFRASWAQNLCDPDAGRFFFPFFWI